MAENEVTNYPAFLEDRESSHTNLSLLSETENLPDDVTLITPLTPITAVEQDQLWMDTERGVSSNMDKPISVTASDSVRDKVKPLKCSECRTVFGTWFALGKHLLTHQTESSHVCNICQKVFKCLEHLTAHMLTHQRRKYYHCCHPGCLKIYCSYRTLKHHCVKQHSYTDCGTSYNNCNLAANLKPEYSNLSQEKLSVVCPSWSLAADGGSCSLEGTDDLSGYHNRMMSNQLASTSNLGGSVVNTAEPEAVNTMEHCLDPVLTNLQTLKKPPSSHTCNEVTGTGMCSEPSSVCLRRNCPIMLKLNMQQHKPQNKKQAPFISGEVSRLNQSSKSNIAGSSPHQIEPNIRHLPPASKSKTKKTGVKKVLKPANIPTPPLPSPNPTSKIRPRPHPAYLISPSQVAMASFSKVSTLSATLKEGSDTAVTRSGRESGESKHAQSSPSCPQAPTTSYMMDQQLLDYTKGGRVEMVVDCYQMNQIVPLSPLLMPVSIPVSSKEAQLRSITNKKHNKVSGHTTLKQQNAKHVSKKSQHPGLLRSLISPSLTAGGYPSQLRSPTYLTDRLLNVNPPPYTPPPMLSPVRPGTGLYFNTIHQYQLCLPQPSIFSASLVGKDRISLTLDNTVVSIDPKINVGSRFQAEIPPLRNHLLTVYDEHPAQLVWAPWGDLSTNPKTQEKVTEFLDMCCSSVLPGGGTNTELALHCLHEVQGAILAAVDLLLIRGDYWTSCHPLSDYNYTGSDHWTAQEMKLFQKALFSHTKNFPLIHQALQTKSVAQCVEYYYSMKKVKNFKKRRGTQNTDRAGINSDTQSSTNEQRKDKIGAKTSLNTPEGMFVDHSAENRKYT